MRIKLFTILFLLYSQLAFTQKNMGTNATKEIANTTFKRPKLVVGIVVDQMRWDYLYRFQEQYKQNGGFKRLLNTGFTYENCFIPYTPTVTAAGHTCVYTGSVPNIHGITGNAWYDSKLNRTVYCSEDNSVTAVGSNSPAGRMSPVNMLTTTVGDELRIASNFQSKVIGIAIKDRGAILPAGHSANAAYWYDASVGKFITSTYYMQQLPNWVNEFNDRKVVDSLYKIGWNTLLPLQAYTLSTADVKPYEAKPYGKEKTGFPYDFSSFIGKSYSPISTTPGGNTLTLEMAKAALVNEQMGKGKSTDMLCVSLSSPDYIGHSFGPNAIEAQDAYLRLDIELGAFFDFLDKNVGKNEYTVMLTADHGVAHIPGFLKENKLPNGTFDDVALMKEMNAALKEKYKADKILVSMYNYQVHLNYPLLDSLDISDDKVTDWVINYMSKLDAIHSVFELEELMEQPMNVKLKNMLANGYYKQRSGSIQFILKPGYIDGGNTGTTHGLWNPYDSHIPCVWMGWGIKNGYSNKEVYMSDIAPTIAALLHIQMPNGSIGNVLEELQKK